MSYMTLYRRFRPDNFADVKGQDHIVTTLRNQIKNQRIGHAYLFSGTRGTGKTTMAKIFARAVNCENPNDNGPCGECATCRAIAAGSGLNVLEIDAASNNGVDSVRDIVDDVAYRPTEGKYKVYIIDEVHMLTVQAFNALLKTLEEPPEYVIFILATTDVNKLLPTVLSRCQRYDFKRISVDTIQARMQELLDKEGLQAQEKALQYIAKTADGSMRDALSFLEECISLHMGEELTYDMALDALGAVDTEVFSRMFRAVRSRDVRSCVDVLDEVIMQGRELGQFVTDYTWYLRNVMLMQTGEDMESVIDMSTENMARLKEDAASAQKEQVFRYIRVMSELSNTIRYATQKRVLTEVAFIRLCLPQMDKDADSVYDRVVAIEEQLENGVVAVAPAGTEGASAQAPARKPMKELPKALPEDVSRIVQNWNHLCSEGKDGVRSILQAATPSLSADGRLELVFAEGDMAYHRAGGELGRRDISERLEEEIGKTVEFTIREASHREMEDTVVDLRKLFDFHIDIDDVTE